MISYACMQIAKSEIALLLARLGQAVAKGNITQSEVARLTGVHQSQVSRILAGQTRRYSPNVIRLCRFAESLHSYCKVDPASSTTLMEALRVVWDGSDSHAQAIANVVLSLKDFQREAL